MAVLRDLSGLSAVRKASATPARPFLWTVPQAAERLSAMLPRGAGCNGARTKSPDELGLRHLPTWQRLIPFLLFWGGGSYPALLGTYSCLCAQEPPLVVHRVPCAVQGQTQDGSIQGKGHSACTTSDPAQGRSDAKLFWVHSSWLGAQGSHLAGTRGLHVVQGIGMDRLAE